MFTSEIQMGSLVSEHAAATMDRIRHASYENCKSHGLPTSHSFVRSGKRYVWKERNRTYTDLGIRGTISVVTNEKGEPDMNGDYMTQTDTFHIDGNGFVVRGPAFFKRYQTVLISS